MYGGYGERLLFKINVAFDLALDTILTGPWHQRDGMLAIQC